MTSRRHFITSASMLTLGNILPFQSVFAAPKTTVGVIRSTFVIGQDGKIEKAQYGVKATGHVARLTADLGV